MRTNWAREIFCVGALSAALLMTGCAGQVGVGYGYTAYDPYYYDFHGWPYEAPYYNQWIIENHRPYRAFHELRPEEQRQYWGWRHSPAARPAERSAGPPRRGR